jgi:hypothetical protein
MSVSEQNRQQGGWRTLRLPKGLRGLHLRHPVLTRADYGRAYPFLRIVWLDRAHGRLRRRKGAVRCYGHRRQRRVVGKLTIVIHSERRRQERIQASPQARSRVPGRSHGCECCAFDDQTPGWERLLWRSRLCSGLPRLREHQRETGLCPCHRSIHRRKTPFDSVVARGGQATTTPGPSPNLGSSWKSRGTNTVSSLQSALNSTRS